MAHRNGLRTLACILFVSAAIPLTAAKAIVTTTSEYGPGSFHQALLDAEAGLVDRIEFHYNIITNTVGAVTVRGESIRNEIFGNSIYGNRFGIDLAVDPWTIERQIAAGATGPVHRRRR